MDGNAFGAVENKPMPMPSLFRHSHLYEIKLIKVNIHQKELVLLRMEKKYTVLRKPGCGLKNAPVKTKDGSELVYYHFIFVIEKCPFLSLLYLFLI